MTEALINPEIIKWARNRSNITIELLSNKIKQNEDKIIKWEQGEQKPTFNQARALAHKLNIPFGYLYLKEPPEEKLPIPDLRCVNDNVNKSLSPDFRDTFYDIKYKHDWYLDYLISQEAEELDFVGKYDTNNSYIEIADAITEKLKIPKIRKHAKNWSDFLGLFRQEIENLRILVFKNGIVKSNTHRPLNVNEFRGFVIVDKLAPLIFINNKDSKSAQIFTLAHELAHIWIGKSGISDISLNMRTTDIKHHIEKFCNKIAAEVLVPQVNFVEEWNNNRNIDENFRFLSRIYKVSPIVIARKALDLNIVEWKEFLHFYTNYKEEIASIAKKKKDGGDFYRTLNSRLSKNFAASVLSSTLEGSTPYLEASKLLNISHGKINEFAKKF